MSNFSFLNGNFSVLQQTGKKFWDESLGALDYSSANMIIRLAVRQPYLVLELALCGTAITQLGAQLYSQSLSRFHAYLGGMDNDRLQKMFLPLAQDMFGPLNMEFISAFCHEEKEWMWVPRSEELMDAMVDFAARRGVEGMEWNHIFHMHLIKEKELQKFHNLLRVWMHVKTAKGLNNEDDAVSPLYFISGGVLQSTKPTSSEAFQSVVEYVKQRYPKNFVSSKWHTDEKLGILEVLPNGVGAPIIPLVAKEESCNWLYVPNNMAELLHSKNWGIYLASQRSTMRLFSCLSSPVVRTYPVEGKLEVRYDIKERKYYVTIPVRLVDVTIPHPISNYGSHQKAAIVQHIARTQRKKMCYDKTYSFWLNYNELSYCLYHLLENRDLIEPVLAWCTYVHGTNGTYRVFPNEIESGADYGNIHKYLEDTDEEATCSLGRHLVAVQVLEGGALITVNHSLCTIDGADIYFQLGPNELPTDISLTLTLFLPSDGTTTPNIGSFRRREPDGSQEQSASFVQSEIWNMQIMVSGHYASLPVFLNLFYKGQLMSTRPFVLARKFREDTNLELFVDRVRAQQWYNVLEPMSGPYCKFYRENGVPYIEVCSMTGTYKTLPGAWRFLPNDTKPYGSKDPIDRIIDIMNYQEYDDNMREDYPELMEQTRMAGFMQSMIFRKPKFLELAMVDENGKPTMEIVKPDAHPYPELADDPMEAFDFQYKWEDEPEGVMHTMTPELVVQTMEELGEEQETDEVEEKMDVSKE